MAITFSFTALKNQVRFKNYQKINKQNFHILLKKKKEIKLDFLSVKFLFFICFLNKSPNKTAIKL
jgi:hypothetical protein